MTVPYTPRRGITLFFIGIVWTIIEVLGLVVIYPNYFLPKTVVSMVGSVSPAFINSGAIIFSGLLLILLVYLLVSEDTGIWFIAPMALACFSITGVGIFSLSDTSLQGIAVLAAFFCCGLCAILELRVLHPSSLSLELESWIVPSRQIAAVRREYNEESSPLLSIFIMRFFCLFFMFLYCLALYSGLDSLFFMSNVVLIFLFPVFIACLGLTTYRRSSWLV